MEQEFFNEDGVVVTNSRFMVGGQTYAMRNITSVKAVKHDPSFGRPLFVGGAGILTAFSGFSNGAPTVGAIGLLLFVIALVIIFRSKPTYAVVLTTSGGEVRAVENPRKAFVMSIVSALNDSIISHA